MTVQLELIARMQNEAARGLVELRGQLEDIRRLAMAMSPTTIPVQWTQTGAEAVQAALQQVASAENQTVSVSIEPTGADSVQRAIDDIDASSPSVTVDVDAAGVDAVQKQLDGIDASAPSVTVDVDAAGVDAVQRQLDGIDASAPSVTVDVDEFGSQEVIDRLQAIERAGAESAGKVGDAFGDLPGPLGDVVSAADDVIGKFTGPGALGLAGGAALAAAAVVGFAASSLAAFAEVDAATDRLQRQLGITEADARQLGDAAQSAFAGNFFGSVTEAAEAVSFLSRSIKSVTNEDIPAMLVQTEAVADTFGAQFAEVASAAESLVQAFDGLTYPQALDMIALGFERGLDRGGDFLDTLGEYSVQFGKAGVSADGFFALLESGLQGGSLGTDKAADAFKEFAIRIQDGSGLTRTSLRNLGIDYDVLTTQINSGAITQADAFQLVIDRLKGIEEIDLLEQTGVGLLGTQFEDLGREAALALTLIGDGAADATGKSAALVKQYDDVGSSVQTLGREWTTLKQGFGELLAPGAAVVIGEVNNALDRMRGVARVLTGETRLLSAEGLASIIDGAAGVIGVADPLYGKLAEGTAFFARYRGAAIDAAGANEDVADSATPLVRATGDVATAAGDASIAARDYDGALQAIDHAAAAQAAADYSAALAEARGPNQELNDKIAQRAALLTPEQAAIRQSNEAISERRAAQLLAAEAEQTAAEAAELARQAVQDFAGIVRDGSPALDGYIATLGNSEAAQDGAAASLQALQQEYRNTAVERALSQAETLEEVDTALRLAVALGTMTQAQANARLEYARDQEAIELVTAAMQDQTVGVDIAARAIEILGSTQGITATEALNMAREMEYAATRADALAISAGGAAGVYELDYTDNSESAIGNANNVRDAAAGAAGDYTIRFNIETSGTIPTGGTVGGGNQPIARAGGGPVVAGGAYIVGDTSTGGIVPGITEMFVPSSSGMIISGSQLQTAMAALSNGQGATVGAPTWNVNLTLNIGGNQSPDVIRRAAESGVLQAARQLGVM